MPGSISNYTFALNILKYNIFAFICTTNFIKSSNYSRFNASSKNLWKEYLCEVFSKSYHHYHLENYWLFVVSYAHNFFSFSTIQAVDHLASFCMFKSMINIIKWNVLMRTFVCLLTMHWNENKKQSCWKKKIESKSIKSTSEIENENLRF